MYKLCVFDLDGTLINSLGDLADSTNYALKKHGFEEKPLENFTHYVGDGVPMLIKRALDKNCSEEAANAVLTDFNEFYSKHYANKTKAYNGIMELLKALCEKKIKIAVLSNKPDNFVKIIVKTLFPSINFASVQGKIEGLPKKPDPSALNTIIENLKADKNEVLYIGDSNVDIFTGHNAGVKACGAVWGFRGREELEKAGADYLADIPLDILKVV